MKIKTKTKTLQHAEGKKKAVVAVSTGLRIKKTARKTAHRAPLSAHVFDCRAPLSIHILDLRVPKVRAPIVSPWQMVGTRERLEVRATLCRKSVLSPFIQATPRVLFKLLALTLMVGLNGVGVSGIGNTIGHYNDTESSNENVFGAGMLDIALSNTTFEGVISNDSGDESQFETNVSLADGSLPTQYVIEYKETENDSSMCDALALDATHGVLSYGSALSAFSVGTTTDFGLWAFVVTVLPGESVTAGETCEFDLIYKARIDGAPATDGFNDEEQFHILIEAAEVESPIVLNEFLPHPNGVLCADDSDNCEEGDPEFIFDFGKDSDDMPQGEWVELYNLIGSPVDLTGWYVQDASGGVGNTQITNLNTLPATTTIPANGYLVIYMNKAVWNNGGDTVKLFNASDALQDSYAYTSDYDYCYLTPTPDETNDEAPSDPDGDCVNGSNIPENKSYARIPNGTGPFVDPVPTPGTRNSLTLNGAEIAALLEQREQPLVLQSNEAPESVIVVESAPAPFAGEIEITEPEPLATSTEAVLDEEAVVESGGAEPEESATAREEEALALEPALEEIPSEAVVEEPAETVVQEEPAVEPEPQPSLEATAGEAI